MGLAVPATVGLTVAAGPPASAAPVPPKLYTKIIDESSDVDVEVGGGRFFVSFELEDATLRAFDLATGAPLWTRSAPGAPGAPEYVHQTGIVYLSHGSDVRAFDAASGAPLRDYPGAGGSQINVDSGVLYSTRDNVLRAVDLASGVERWAVPIGSVVDPFDIPGDGFVYVAEGVGTSRCINKRNTSTGLVARQSCGSAVSLGGPRVLPGARRVVHHNSLGVSGLRSSDLATLWSKSFSGSVAMGATQRPAARVAVSTSNGRVALLKAGNGAQVCNRRVGDVGATVIPEFDPATGNFVTVNLGGNGIVGVSPTCNVLWRVVRSTLTIDDLTIVGGYLVVVQWGEISVYRL